VDNHKGRCLSDAFPIQNGFVTIALHQRFRIRHYEVHGNQEGFDLNEKHQLLMFGDNVNSRQK
jgi:hypothetical protein